MEIVKERSTVLHKNRASKKPTTVAEFEQWEAKRKGDWNYEFYYGEIVKKAGMKPSEILLADFLIRCFLTTEAFNKRGTLMPECDVYIDEFSKRIPDLAYFERSQIVAATKGEKAVPAFAIEILSPNEPLIAIEDKLKDYFDAGVELVWYISVKHKNIYAYTSRRKVEIFTSGQLITANPVLPDFEINISELFSGR